MAESRLAWLRLAYPLPRSHLWCAANTCADIGGRGDERFFSSCEHDRWFWILTLFGRSNDPRLCLTAQFQRYRFGEMAMP
jgi:hypothetical protein